MPSYLLFQYFFRLDLYFIVKLLKCTRLFSALVYNCSVMVTAILEYIEPMLLPLCNVASVHCAQTLKDVTMFHLSFDPSNRDAPFNKIFNDCVHPRGAISSDNIYACPVPTVVPLL